MKVISVTGISLILSKSTMKAAKFNVPIQRANRYEEYLGLYNACTAERFNSGIFGIETSDCGSVPSFLLISIMQGIEPGTATCEAVNLPLATEN